MDTSESADLIPRQTVTYSPRACDSAFKKRLAYFLRTQIYKGRAIKLPAITPMDGEQLLNIAYIRR